MWRWKNSSSAPSLTGRTRPPARLAAALALALPWTLAAGCAAWRPHAPPSLRIGIVADSPPLAFRDHRRWAGVEADLARALADRLGMRPVFVSLPPDQLEPALFNDRVDVLMAGLPITEERRVRMDFASPYLVVGQGALIRKADLPRFNTDIKIRSARGLVGVVEGTGGERLVSRYFAHAQPAAFDDLDSALADLRENQIDVLVYDAPALWWILQTRPDGLALAPALFAREEIAWGFRRGSVGLRESANQALADWQRDGTLETILRRWLPVSR